MKRQTTPEKQKQRSIASGVFRSFMVFALFLILVLWILQTVLLESFYKQIKTQTLKNTAESVVSAIENAENISDRTLIDAVTDLAVRNEVSIEIIDCENSSEMAAFHPLFSIVTNQDNVLYVLRDSEMYFIYSDAREAGGELLQKYQRVSSTHPLWRGNRDKSAADDETDETDGTSESEDESEEYSTRPSYKHGAPPFFKTGITQELLYARIVSAKDGHEYLLLFDGVITPIATTVRTLKIQLLFVTVIILLVAAFMARWLSRRISRPIAGINTSAKKLASGDFDTSFSGGHYLEITQLSDTLNYTAHELKEADNLKRELIANTSHDLRTPLTMIIGYAEVMRDLPGENTPENVQVIIDEARRLTTLVNDMLDLSKLSSGTEELSVSEFNLTRTTEEIVERIRKLTEKDGFRFRFEYENPVFVNADQTKIMQVIYNFLTNAVNYSEENREITVRQTVTGKTVRLSFIDHGKGIPKEKLPNIWDRYYKIDSTHKRSHVGSGIGLSIVKTILEKHNARYGVVSNVESGSTFWFELPVSDEIK